MANLARRGAALVNFIWRAVAGPGAGAPGNRRDGGDVGSNRQGSGASGRRAGDRFERRHQIEGGGVRGLRIGIQAVGNYCNQAGRKAGAELAREECDMLHLRR